MKLLLTKEKLLFKTLFIFYLNNLKIMSKNLLGSLGNDDVVLAALGRSARREKTVCLTLSPGPGPVGARGAERFSMRRALWNHGGKWVPVLSRALW